MLMVHICASGQLPGFIEGLSFWHWALAFVVLVGIWRRLRPTQLGRLEAVPLRPETLPHDVKAFLEAHDEPLSEMGFYPAGDYQTVHGSKPNYARFYACALADMYVEVDVYRKIGGGPVGGRDFKGVTCTTVFDDGASLHTGDFPLPDDGSNAPPQLIYRGRPGLTLEELIAAHREDAEECTAEHGPILQYPPEALAGVSIYYAQYQREYFVNRGVIPPPDGYEQTQAMLEAEEKTLTEIRA